jgi:hypothetical protein
MRGMNNVSSGFLGIEKKFYDTSTSTSTPSTASALTGGECDPAEGTLSAPAQGDGPSDRDGKKILITSVQVNGIVFHAPINSTNSGTAAPQGYFIALVLDTQTNGAQLNSEDVFVNPSANVTLNAHPLRNMLQSSRFRVLKKWVLKPEVSPYSFDGTNWSTAGMELPFECYLKTNIEANFTAGVTADVSNVVDNSLHVVAFADNPDITPVMRYNARIRFVG